MRLLKRKVLLIVFFLFSINTINGQNKKLIKKARALADSFQLYEFDDSVKASQFIRKAKKLAFESKDSSTIAFIFRNLSWYYEDAMQYEKAMNALLQSMKYCTDDKCRMDNYSNMANVHLDYDDQKNALNALNKALAISLKLINKTKNKKTITEIKNTQIAIYATIGNVYAHEKMIDKCIEYNLKALEISKETGNNRYLKGIYHNLSVEYKYKKNYVNAKKYLKESLKQCENEKNDYEKILIYTDFSKLSQENKLLDSANYFIDKALLITNNVPFSENHVTALNQKINLLILQKKYLLALQLAEMNALNCEKYNLKSSKTVAYRNLYQIEKALGHYAKSLSYHEKYFSWKDSMNNNERKRSFLSKALQSEYQNKTVIDSIKQQNEKELMQYRHEKEIADQRKYVYIFSVGLIIVLLIAILIYRNYKQKKHANNQLVELNKTILEQKEEVEIQKEIIEEKQKEITDSINYAKRIQFTLLAHDVLLKENLKEHFVLFKPKDIVSGDFYWATKILNAKNENDFYLAVCDSTGHGVPGAFMSLLNISFLNEAIIEKNIVEPHLILNYVRTKLIEKMEGAKDGMDAILLQKTGNNIYYSAANNKPVLIQNSQIIELVADKMPVGKGEKNNSFTLNKIENLESGVLYFYTDGFADQFGLSEESRQEAYKIINSTQSTAEEIKLAKTTLVKGKKFKYSQLNSLLLSIHHLPFQKQEEILYDRFLKWKGNLEQVDDVCIIGLKI